MAYDPKEDNGTDLSRRDLLVRGGLLGLFAIVAPSLLAADDAEAGYRSRGKRKHGFRRKHHAFSKRRAFKRHHGFKRHRVVRKHHGFKARRHAAPKHRVVRHHAFKRHAVRRPLGFKKTRVVRFKKRW
jgi:hypothetical protein